MKMNLLSFEKIKMYDFLCSFTRWKYYSSSCGLASRDCDASLALPTASNDRPSPYSIIMIFHQESRFQPEAIEAYAR